MKFLKEMAVQMDEKAVSVINHDDKTLVLIGFLAANKQIRVSTHLEYRVRLLDHDWVVASKHKLTSSVNGVYL